MKVLIGLLLVLSNIYQWKCAVALSFTVDVTSCNYWGYGEKSNLLQIQLRGTEGATSFEYVNPLGGLPTNGNSDTYTVSSSEITDIGDLLSVVFRVDDHDGYCIKDFNVSNYHHFTSEDYWGDGIILSNKCANSYQFLSSEISLISCHENNFELKTDSQRGIYNVDIHTCQGKMGSDISTQNMKNNLYLSIMGNNEKTKDYLQTDVTFLDHYVGGNIDLSMVGHVIASNVQLTDSYETAPVCYFAENNADVVPKASHWYLTQHENPTRKPLEVAGIQIESINYVENPITIGKRAPNPIEVRLNGKKAILNNVLHTHDDRFYQVMFTGIHEVNLSTSVEIIRTSNVFLNGFYNVKVIVWDYYANGYHKDYKVPFEFRRAERIKMNWFEANQYCKETFGTSLASIHSQNELAFIDFAFPGQKQWIGLFNKRNNKNDQNWIWSDKSYFDSSKTSPPPIIYEHGEAKDCTVINRGKWSPETCTNNNTVNYFVCASPNWLPNTHRKFQVNSAQKIDDITLVTIGNNNHVDDICIDSISVEGNTAKSITSNWISNGEKSYALFKHPICGMEITKVDVKFDKSTSVKIPQDSKKVGYKCENNNRIISTTCSVSEIFEFEKTTGLSLEKEWSRSKEFAHGDKNKNTIDVRWGTSLEMSIGEEDEAAGMKISAGVKTKTTMTQTDGNSVSAHKEWADSRGITDTTHDSWITTETTSVECSAEVDIPPGHSIEYELVFNAVSATLVTSTDIKLTLCPAYIGDTAEKYIVVNNIKGYINSKETQSCEVKVTHAEYLRNKVTCEDSQKLAIAEKSTYSPLCKKEDHTKYDGCQCNIGDLCETATCWCVDEDGNPIAAGQDPGNTLLSVNVSTSWQDACVNLLQCGNSAVEYNSSAEFNNLRSGLNIPILCG